MLFAGARCMKKYKYLYKYILYYRDVPGGGYNIYYTGLTQIHTDKVLVGRVRRPLRIHYFIHIYYAEKKERVKQYTYQRVFLVTDMILRDI